MLRRGSIGAGIAAVAVAAAAIPALAGTTDLGTIGGFTYVQDSSESVPSEGDNGVTVPCPDGQFLVGGGGGAEGGRAGKYIHSSGPVDGPDGDSESNDAWGLSYHAKHGSEDAIAVCADAEPQVVMKTVNIPVNQTGKATAKCPSDLHVSGGGVAIDGNPSDSFLNSSFPVDGSDDNKTPDDGWTGRAAGPAGGTVEMQVTALCVSSPRTYMTHRPGSVKPHSGVASLDYCKGQEGVLSGAGLRIPGPGRQARIKIAIPNDDPTAGDPNITPEERIVYGMTNLRGTRKTPTAYAICKPN